MNELVSKEARGGIACAMACLMLALGALPAFADPWIPQPIETVRVEGGSFTTYDGQKITVNGFLIGKTEITQNQFAWVMGYNPSWFVGRKTETLPVEDANWYEAVEFCNRLSLHDGLQPVYTISGSGAGQNAVIDYTKNGWRLPTQAEWIFAAKGGNKSKGFKYAGSNNVDEVAWYALLSNGLPHEGTTHPVATKAPNELGLYDMSGNVLEWCNDYDGGFPSGLDNPTGPASGWQRMMMGGAWCYSAYWCGTEAGKGYEPLDGAFRLGIRVVRPLPAAAKYAEVRQVFDKAGPAVEKAAADMEVAADAKAVALAVKEFSAAMVELITRMNGFLKTYPELTNGSRAPEELKESSDRFNAAQGRYRAASEPKLAAHAKDPAVIKALADMQKAMAASSQ